MKLLNKTIFGLPAPKRISHSTRPKGLKNRNHVYKVTINGSKYYKVHFHRGDLSKIKYFKKLKEAKLFVLFLGENSYL